MNTELTDKIKSVAERRKFNSFWEAYDFFMVAGYDEIKAIKIALEISKGNVWLNVINASKSVGLNFSNFSFVSGSTYCIGVDTAFEREPDDLEVEVFIMDRFANPAYVPMLKAYTETRQYKQVPELESQIKIIKTKLTTELAIQMFNDGYENL